MSDVALAKVERVAITMGRSPVNSLKILGVRLYHGRTSLFCAPEDPEALLAALDAACPHLYRYGGELRPRPG